jgi:hypothetical protein
LSLSEAKYAPRFFACKATYDLPDSITILERAKKEVAEVLPARVRRENGARVLSKRYLAVIHVWHAGHALLNMKEVIGRLNPVVLALAWKGSGATT